MKSISGINELSQATVSGTEEIAGDIKDIENMAIHLKDQTGRFRI